MSTTNENDGFNSYRHWARTQFIQNRQAVAFIETEDKVGKIGIGSGFHVGDGVFVTARHVVEGMKSLKVGFDDFDSSFVPIQEDGFWSPREHEPISIVDAPHFHTDANIDVACFKINRVPRQVISLGAHLDDWMSQFELVLHQTLVIGYPRIPFSDRPVLTAAVGEINALIEMYRGGHPHFVISTMARGGFSGAPALVAYDEANAAGGTAALGLVTESLIEDNKATELGYSAVLTVEPLYDCLEHNDMLPEAQKINFDEEGNMI